MLAFTAPLGPLGNKVGARRPQLPDWARMQLVEIRLVSQLPDWARMQLVGIRLVRQMHAFFYHTVSTFLFFTNV